MTKRDTVSGRFTSVVDTSNTPESSAGKFPTRRRIPIEDWSAADVRAGMERARYGPSADDLAQGGQRWPVHHRLPVMALPDDGGDAQGAVLRAAARQAGPESPVIALVSGFGPNGASGGPGAQEGDLDG